MLNYNPYTRTLLSLNPDWRVKSNTQDQQVSDSIMSRLPVDNHGQIIHPVHTDDLVMKICKDKLGIELSKNDIGRIHVIGNVKDGKSQVIVRLLSYRVKNQVYSNKRQLKQNEDGILVTENITQFRTSLRQTFSKLKYEHKIHVYWTSDGRIFAKENVKDERKL